MKLAAWARRRNSHTEYNYVRMQLFKTQGLECCLFFDSICTQRGKHVRSFKQFFVASSSRPVSKMKADSLTLSLTHTLSLSSSKVSGYLLVVKSGCQWPPPTSGISRPRVFSWSNCSGARFLFIEPHIHAEGRSKEAIFLVINPRFPPPR
jgi:hypothetical protein